MKLGGNKQLFPVDAGVLNCASNDRFVLVVGGGVDVPVSLRESLAYRTVALIAAPFPGAKPEHGDDGSAPKGECGSRARLNGVRRVGHQHHPSWTAVAWDL